MVLTRFSDVDYANCIDDRRSITRYAIHVGDNLIARSAQKQKVVARASAEFEYRSLASTTTKILWLQSLFTELGIPQLIGIPII